MNTQIIRIKPDTLETEIICAVEKNTLPEVRERWTAWLNQFNAEDLKTDKDFSDADMFVKDCQKAEDHFEAIKEAAINGNVLAAIKEIDNMREAARQKRLEFSKALKTRKDSRKDELIKKAAAKVEQGLAALSRHSRPDVMSQLLAAVKGKSSFGNMEAALEAEADSIIEAEQVYCNRFDELKAQTAKVFSVAGEVVLEIELNDLVKNHFENAPERAGVIIESKRLAREKAKFEEQKKQEAAPVQTQPEPAKPQPAPEAAQINRPYAPPYKLIRFGVTFNTDDPEALERVLTEMGGQDIRTAAVKK